MKFSPLLPRLSRGSFFCLFILFCAAPLPAQFKFREPPNRQDPAVLDALQGEALWDWFLANRAVGSFQLQGELVHRPAGAPSESLSVFLNADWSPHYEETEIRLAREDGMSVERVVTRSQREAIVSDNDPDPSPYPLNWDGPIIRGFPFTWFDLLMPFLEWDAVEYLGPDRYLGRPAHRYGLTNPDVGSFPARVVVTLDEDFAALLKVDMYEGARIKKRMRVGGFKKFGDVWMASELIWLDRNARSSVRLEVYQFTSTP